MPPNSYSQNNNDHYNDPYTSGGYEKSKIRLLLIVVAVFVLVCIGVIALAPHSSPTQSKQDKNTQSATAAAKKKTPNAKVSNVKVADGFALATVSDPTATSQANAGNITVFKVNKDGSMVQIAEGSYFGPLDLLELGIPLATQAKLSGTDIGQVEQNLADQCGYSNGTIGMNGFDGTYSPGQWQIDASTLDILSQKLSTAISAQNANATGGKSVICVKATQNNSNVTTNTTTYISTYTLQVQFITADGTLTTHTLTFTNGSPRFRTYTLDGQAI